MKKALLAFEIPWADEGSLVEWSMQSFLRGLALRHHFHLLYRTFTTSAELNSLLTTHFPRGDETGSIVYIGSHGYGTRLSAEFGPSINLKPVAEKARRELEGVWLSACGIADSAGVVEFLLRGGAIWAGGYTGEVSWDSAMLIDLAVMNEVMSSGLVNTKADAVKLMARALSTFNSEWKVDRDESVCLRDSIRLLARDGVQGSRACDVTGELLEELRWSAEHGQRSA